MQPRSWSPSHPLSPALSLPRSFSFSIRISQTELSLPAASIYKYHQFTPLVLWSSGLFRHTNFKVPALLFPPKMSSCPPLCPLSLSVRSLPSFSSCSPSHSLSHHLIQILYFLSFSLFFLQVWPPELCQTREKTHRGKFTGANTVRVSTHTHTHTHTHRHTHSSLPSFTLLFCHSHPFHCKFSKTHSRRRCWSANRTHSTVLNTVRAIQPFLLHRQTLTPFPKCDTPDLQSQACMSVRLCTWAGEKYKKVKNEWHWQLSYLFLSPPES